jgi:hypothetical protein
MRKRMKSQESQNTEIQRQIDYKGGVAQIPS